MKRRSCASQKRRKWPLKGVSGVKVSLTMSRDAPSRASPLNLAHLEIVEQIWYKVPIDDRLPRKRRAGEPRQDPDETRDASLLATKAFSSPCHGLEVRRRALK